jgi:deoxyribodipyrimidine photolyase-related protein
VREATDYVETHFAEHPGQISNFFYPVTPKDAEKWLDDFLCQRFSKFGPYEDAICKDETFLFHSGLSPLLNSGLLLPQKVLDRTLKYAEQNDVPMQSTEGFVRQIVGWREYVRAMYVLENDRLRNGNYFSLSGPIPKSFYTAATGIEPVDNVLRRVLEHAYCHHIERLMVLGTFLQLCEIAPEAVYCWFMEMFIDAYDWVMVPNVYGMSQFAAGAMMMTKPYLCGSNYILKMSNFSRGPWCAVWDGLFWRFLHRHRAQLEPIVRLRMMLRQLDKMPKAKLKQHLAVAERFLAALV